MNHIPSITLKGRFHLAGDLLFDANLQLDSRRWTCLLGPSGIGKTTILRLILGLDTGGSFEGVIKASDGKALDQRIGYMAQSDLLLPWLTLRDNLLIGARLRGETPDIDRAEALLERVGLIDAVHKKPPALSGGMRQRVALARTLMEDRSVILLDEPFSALDAGTRADMQELATELLHGRTVLLVTHDPSEAARLGHQILLMSQDEMRNWPVPKGDIPRAYDDPELQSCHTDLLAELRGRRS